MGQAHTIFETAVNHYFSSLPQSAFEDAYCFLCDHGTESVELFKKHSLAVRRCRCGFVYSAKQPTAKTLDDFYRSGPAMDTWVEHKKGVEESTREGEKYWTAFSSVPNPKQIRSVLDVGCGHGGFLDRLSGWIPDAELVGIDTHSGSLVTAARRVPKAKFHVEQLESDAPIDHLGKFDLVAIMGVLEHVKNPVRLLRKYSSLLNQNGNILVCVPNIESDAVRVMGKRAYTFCPQHLWYFSPETLMKTFLLAGLSIQTVKTAESESVPISRVLSLFDDPYKAVPDWALTQTAKECGPLSGYKILACATPLKEGDDAH